MDLPGRHVEQPLRRLQFPLFMTLRVVDAISVGVAFDVVQVRLKRLAQSIDLRGDVRQRRGPR